MAQQFEKWIGDDRIDAIYVGHSIYEMWGNWSGNITVNRREGGAFYVQDYGETIPAKHPVAARFRDAIDNRI